MINFFFRQTLTHLIDTMQLLKTKETETVKYTLSDLATELAKSMDSSDKDRVDEIKRELHWR